MTRGRRSGVDLPPDHTAGRLMRCLTCGRDIAENCQRCRRRHARKYHGKELK